MNTVVGLSQLHKYEKSNNLISADRLEYIKSKTGFTFGNQLVDYILNYGYLAAGCVEFYGINAKQDMESDMIKQTLYLHTYYPCTNPFIALENRGESDYILADNRDNIFEFLPELNNKLLDLQITVFDYMINRLKSGIALK